MSAAPRSVCLTGRDVHREWRDGRQQQGRYVAAERRDWETLDPWDQELDERLAGVLSDIVLATPRRWRTEHVPTLFDDGQYEEAWQWLGCSCGWNKRGNRVETWWTHMPVL